jgi:hypothetical protein
MTRLPPQPPTTLTGEAWPAIPEPEPPPEAVLPFLCCARMPGCSRHERAMPRRRPAQLRAEILPRLFTGRGATVRVSKVPGLSPWGRTVLARLEHHHLWPGATTDALQKWEGFVRSPYHRLYDTKYEANCGHWGCCTPISQVRWVLDVVAHNLPRRDARRFRERLAAINDAW